jgi:hypothetical protein
MTGGAPMRAVDKAATRKARARQKAGAKRLDELFALAGGLWAMKTDAQTGRPTRVRVRPGVPPAQSAEHKRRRRLRKIARASRKRNR